MSVRLYWIPVSHPSQAARKMLELKGPDYELVGVMPFNQRIHLRAVGFRGGTVPALNLDGQRVQGSRQIARALDARWPEPPLLPSEPELRSCVEEAERWGEQVLQPVPRRIGRYGAAHSLELRRWGAEGLPFPDLLARASAPLAGLFTRTVEVDGRRAEEDAVKADLAAVPSLLARVEELLEDGTLALDPPNAATLQILSSVRLLDAYSDLHPYIGSTRAAQASREVFPRYPGPMPRFLPDEWLEPVASAYGG